MDYSFLNEIRKEIVPVDKEGYYATIFIEDYIEKDGEKVFIINGEIYTDAILECDRSVFDNIEEIGQPRFFTYGYTGLLKVNEFIELFSLCKMGPVCAMHINGNCLRHGMDDCCESFNLLTEQFNYNKQAGICFLEHWNREMSKRLYRIKFFESSLKSFDVYFSASPFVQKKIGISFCELTNKNIPDFSKISQKISERSNTFSIEDNLIPLEVQSYWVRQGNFSIIVCDNKETMIFDPGFTYLEQHESFKEALCQYEQVNPKYVFISHLDLDHYLGIVYLNEDVFKKAKWVVAYNPQGRITASAKRLLCVLYKNPQASFVSEMNYSNNYFDLKMGANKRIGHCNKINNNGLLLKIINGKKVLFTGDCIYEAMPISLKDEYDVLMVPHHGCDLGNNMPISNIKRVKDGIAVLSYGNNKYGHPNENHLEQLKAIDYAIVDLSKAPEHAFSYELKSH